jgi:hypothetical protein
VCDSTFSCYYSSTLNVSVQSRPNRPVHTINTESKENVEKDAAEEKDPDAMDVDEKETTVEQGTSLPREPSTPMASSSATDAETPDHSGAAKTPVANGTIDSSRNYARKVNLATPTYSRRSTARSTTAIATPSANGSTSHQRRPSPNRRFPRRKMVPHSK